MNTDTKPWWTSKTMWGGILLLAFGAAKQFGWDLSGDDQASIGDAFLQIVEAAWLIVGGVLTIWGRLSAVKRVKIKSSTPMIALVALAPAVLLAGCNSLTPLQQSVQARELYISTLNVLTQYRAAGYIDDETALQIEEIRQIAATALDDLEAAALTGESNTFRSHLATLNHALDRLIAWRIQIGRSHDDHGNPADGEGGSGARALPGWPGHDAPQRGARTHTRRNRPGQSAAEGGRSQVARSAAEKQLLMFRPLSRAA